MRKVLEINNVWFKPTIISGSIFYIDYPTKGLIRMDDNFIPIRISGTKVNYLFIWNNLIHINKLKFLSIDKLEITEKNFLHPGEADNLTFLLKSSGKVIFKIVNEPSETVTYFLLTNDFTCTQLNYSIRIPILLTENKISCRNGDTITTFDALSGLELWHFNFKDYVKGEGVKRYGEIINYNNRLFFYLSSGMGTKQAATFCVDENTGKVLHRFDDFTGDLFLCGDKIYTSSWYRVQTLDTKTMTVLQADYTDVLKPHDLFINYGRSIVTENGLLYFVDGAGRPTHRFGILDLNAGTMVGHGAINKNGEDSILNIQVHGNRLYVFSLGHVLHVFEMEE